MSISLFTKSQWQFEKQGEKNWLKSKKLPEA